MFELQEEKTLLYSDDMSITLTTHRIIQQTNKGSKQIMLEDFEKYELKKAHIGNYNVLTNIFAFLSFIAICAGINNYNTITSAIDWRFFQYLLEDFTIVLCLMMLLISSFLYTISRRFYIQINSKYERIDFRVHSLKKKSVTQFLKKLTEQSEIRKAIEAKKLKEIRKQNESG